MPDIFISYSHTDKDWVEKFHEDLEKRLRSAHLPGVEIWRDPKLRAGDVLDDSILAALRGAGVLLVVVSRAWVASKYCRMELAEFVAARGKAAVVAIDLTEVTDVPAPLDELTRPRFYRSEHGRQLSISAAQRKKEVEKLANDIEAKLKAQKANPQVDALVTELRSRIREDIRARCGTMRVLTMQQPIDIGSIYTEVNILEKRAAHSRQPLDELIRRANVDGQPFGVEQTTKRVPGLEAVRSNPRLMIYGKPGAGKTTFLKRLAFECGEGRLRSELVPVFVTLKDFAEAKGEPALPDYVRSLWRDEPQTKTVLGAGRAIVLLDGLDEVLDCDFERVRKQIEAFATAYPQCPVVLTCRIAAREYLFPQFAEVEMADFGQREIKAFGRNWFKAKGDEKKAEAFFERLKANTQLLELASSPLLLTLLCLVFEDRTDFDGNRAELYKEGLDVMLRSWDAKRSIDRDRPYRNLTVTQREALLSEIAYGRFAKGEPFFEQVGLEREIEEFFQQRSLLDAGEELRPYAVLNAIEHQHGLLVQRAKGIYSFSHLTFQEYLAAQQIAKNPALIGASAGHLGDHRWREVWKLLADMMNAEFLFPEWKRLIDDSVRGAGKIQEALTWTRRKAAAAQGDYRPPALRAFYLNVEFFLGRDLAFALDSALEHPRAIPLSLALDGALGSARNIAEVLYLEIDFSIGLRLGLGRAVLLANEVTPGLARELQKLGRRLPDRSDSEEWRRDGPEWRQQLRSTCLRYRDVGHDWGFSDFERDSLATYFNANLLLVERMKSAKGLKTATRAAIEDSLLLPYAELHAKSPAG